MAANQLYRLRLQLTYTGIIQYWYMVFKGLTVSSTALDLTNKWSTAASSDFAAMANCMSNGVRLIRVRAERISNAGGEVSDVAAASTLFGTLTGSNYPAYVQGYMKWLTGSTDRRKIGHNYMTGIAASGVSAGVFTSSRVASYQNFVTRIVGQYGPSGANANWRAGVYSVKNGGHFPNCTLAGWTQITGGNIIPIVTTNRKRAYDHAANFLHPWLT